LGIASIAWLALLPATQLQIGDEFAMDDFTPFTDTGHGMFLVFGPPLFATIWIGTIVVGRFIVLRNVLLPADLWCWDGTRRRRSLVWTVFYGLLSALLIALVGFSTFTFPWSLPTWILGLYVILSTRAALVNCSQ